MNLSPHYKSRLGAEVRVTGHSHQGQTKRQEDAIDVAFHSDSDTPGESLYAFFGVFDGHGGPEAAVFVKKHLIRHITDNYNFWSDTDSRILRAIKEGFLSVQESLWMERQAESRAASSSSTRRLSCPGTTATIAFLKNSKLYIGHVGNSGIVVGVQEPGSHFWRAKKVTEEHTPDKLPERERMRRSGLAVKSTHGIPRVVSYQGKTSKDLEVEEEKDDEAPVSFSNSPFLPLARSLGDLWSYCREKQDFLVSPVPDTFVVELDDSFKCLLLATDGLWSVVSEQDAVDTVFHAERSNQLYHKRKWVNPSKKLVKQAMAEWQGRRLRADNTSVITVVFDKVMRSPTNEQGEDGVQRVSSKEEFMDQYWKALIIALILVGIFYVVISVFDA
ncbi:Protein phosphatase 1D [Orchesella cincta]|uniref:Protein phosphatase 1D n=1 Tax=Orchesella cincta TaxID=48709 RepID=A0A1D2MGA3_ORCCI|nr:Protein phosphatase 1D [Orchesella cincta]